MARHSGREALRRIPHLAVGERRARYDIGDEIARRHGVWVVTTGCGEEMNTTLATWNRDRVRCPECLAATTNPPD